MYKKSDYDEAISKKETDLVDLGLTLETVKKQEKAHFSNFLVLVTKKMGKLTIKDENHIICPTCGQENVLEKGTRRRLQRAKKFLESESRE